MTTTIGVLLVVMLFVNAIECVGKLQRQKYTCKSNSGDHRNPHAYHCMRVEGILRMYDPTKPRKTVKGITYTLIQQTKIKYGWVIIVLCSELKEIFFETEILSKVFSQAAIVSKVFL